jgi:hypothetical protein
MEVKSSAIFLSAAAPKTSTRRQLLPNDGKSFRSVAIPQCQITVPNFVPFVSEIVPYHDVSSSYSIVLSRIGVFCSEHSLQAAGRDFRKSVDRRTGYSW